MNYKMNLDPISFSIIVGGCLLGLVYLGQFTDQFRSEKRVSAEIRRDNFQNANKFGKKNCEKDYVQKKYYNCIQQTSNGRCLESVLELDQCEGAQRDVYLKQIAPSD